jgi:tyrosine-protein phosphatase YwqE
VCFELQSKGYQPVLAHPERYIYLYNDFGKYEELCDRGLLLQLNISSLVGYYSPMAKKIAEKLIDNKMVHMVGTDCHSMKQTVALEKAMQTSYFYKLRDLPLLNNTL